MTPDVVVDIGNSRLKMGWCSPPEGGMRVARLRANSPTDWTEHIDAWNVPRPISWAVASVHPARLETFLTWVSERGERAAVLDSFSKLALEVDVDSPASVGIDRLLDAVAARARLPKGTPGIIIDAGTAVTVNLLNEDHVFMGGAILPGPRLMADSLHTYTAKLPDVDIGEVPETESPGKNTEDAIEVGIRSAVSGAAFLLVREMAAGLPTPPWVFLTGGSLGSLTVFDFGSAVGRVIHDPKLTLEGIRIAAEALP